MAYVSIFTDSDLTHITEDHFEIKLIARLLDQIYVIQPPMFPPQYDDAPPQEYEYSQPHTSTDGASVRSNLAIHCSDTPFIIRQPISRPHLLEWVYKPIHTPHWCGDLQSLL